MVLANLCSYQRAIECTRTATLRSSQINLNPVWIGVKLEVFMQEGAPCHTTELVINWLKFYNVKLLTPWPGNSVDLTQ